jgi:hypothetical protein
MSFYDIDWSLLIKRVLPTQKRDVWHVEWLESALKGIRIVYDDFTTFKTTTLTTLSYNSQRLLFEKAINDQVDETLQRVYIDNSADDIEESFCYQIAEAQEDAFCYQLAEEPFSGRYTYQLIEYITPLDFTVYVPNVLINSTQTIIGIINFYKLAGKRYIIKYF